MKAIAETIVTWSIAADAMEMAGIELTLMGIIAVAMVMVYGRHNG